MHYIDPVCKKKLHKKQEFAIKKVNGQVFHLCCQTCSDVFEKDPNRYMKKN
jgi:YHS domain-containing protein